MTVGVLTNNASTLSTGTSTRRCRLLLTPYYISPSEAWLTPAVPRCEGLGGVLCAHVEWREGPDVCGLHGEMGGQMEVWKQGNGEVCVWEVEISIWEKKADSDKMC